MEKEKKNLKQRGNDLYKQGHFGMAVKMYQKYVSKPHEDNKNAYCNMALCYFKQQRYQECIEACKQALRIDATYAKVYYRLALAYDQIDNEYQCFANADQFCRINKQNKKTSDYQEMKELREKCRNKFTYPTPTRISQRDQLFYPGYDIHASTQKKETTGNQNNKQQKQTYIGGNSWEDVQARINEQQYKSALDMAYGIIRNTKPSESNHKLGKQNIKIVKGIESGKISNQTKLYTDISQIPKQKNSQEKKEEEKQTGSIPSQQPPIEKAFQKISLEDQADLDNYTKYFLKPLQQKPDLFEGFATVIISVLSDPNLKSAEMEQILQKAQKQYSMFLVLQSSLSNKQKQQIKKLLQKSGLNKKLVDTYCS